MESLRKDVLGPSCEFRQVWLGPFPESHDAIQSSTLDAILSAAEMRD